MRERRTLISCRMLASSGLARSSISPLGKILFVTRATNRVELTRQILDQLPQHGRFIPLGQNRRTRLHRLVTQTRDLQDREWIETGAFNTQSPQHLRRISQPVEVPFDSARA